MATLRQKQNMEILDVFKDIHNQVVQRQLKQISVFPDTLKPKTERDLGAEVNVDKAVEQINRTLEQKLGTLEFFLQNVRRIDDPRFSQSVIQSQEQSTNTGDVIPLYNTISRISHQTGLSRESRQVIRVQLQALTPNLDAILYGLSQAVQRVMKEMELAQEASAKTGTSAVLDFLRTYAVYQFIRKQVDGDNTSSVELLTVEALNTEFRNSFEQLSQNDIAIIKERLPNANWLLSSGMKNVPDFPSDDYEGRMRALENELGFKISDTMRARLKTLPLHAQKESLVKIKTEVRPPGRAELTEAEVQMIRRAEQIAQDARDLTNEIERLRQQKEMLEEEVELLVKGAQVDPDNAEALLQLVPELPVVQDAPQLLNFPTQEAWEQAFQAWEESRTEFKEKQAEVDRIVAENEFIKSLSIPETSRAQRQEAIQSKLEMIQVITSEIPKIQEQQEIVESQADSLVAQSGSVAPAVSAIVERPVGPRVIPPEIEAERKRVIDEIKGVARIDSDDPLNLSMFERVRGLVTAFNTKYSRMPQVRIQISPSNPPRLLVKKAPAKSVVAPRPAPVVDDEKENVGEGMASRGLGSLRRNYGFRESDSEEDESESESDSDPLDFDDRRNEHYYTRPR